MDSKKLVIIPTFNNASHIKNTLDSIPSDFDICIIDSGSMDDTLKICSKYTNKLMKRTIYPWDAGDQRNYAYEKYKEKYKLILFLDSDEKFTPELVAEIADLQRNKAYCFGAIRSTYKLRGRALNSVSRNTYHDRLVFNVSHDNELFSSSPGEVFTIDRACIYHLSASYAHDVDAKGYSDWIKRIFAYAYQNGRKDAQSIKNDSKRSVKNAYWFRKYRIIFLFTLPMLYFSYYIIIRKAYLDGINGLLFAAIMSLAYLTYPIGFFKELLKRNA